MNTRHYLSIMKLVFIMSIITFGESNLTCTQIFNKYNEKFSPKIEIAENVDENNCFVIDGKILGANDNSMIDQAINVKLNIIPNESTCVRVSLLFSNRKYTYNKCIKDSNTIDKNDKSYNILLTEIKKMIEYVDLRNGISAKSVDKNSLVIDYNNIIELFRKLCIENGWLQIEHCKDNSIKIIVQNASKEENEGKNDNDGLSFKFFYSINNKPEQEDSSLNIENIYLFRATIFNASKDYLKLIITTANQDYEILINRYALGNDKTINQFILEEYGQELFEILTEINPIDSENKDLNVMSQAASLPLAIKAFSKAMIKEDNSLLNPIKLMYVSCAHEESELVKELPHSDFNELKKQNDFLLTHQEGEYDVGFSITKLNSIEGKQIPDKCLNDFLQKESNHVKLAYGYQYKENKDEGELIYVDIYNFNTDFFRSVDIKFYTLHFSSEYLVPWEVVSFFKDSMNEITQKFKEQYATSLIANKKRGKYSINITNVKETIEKKLKEKNDYCFHVYPKEENNTESDHFEIYVKKRNPEDCSEQKNSIESLNEGFSRLVKIYKKKPNNEELISVVLSNLNLIGVKQKAFNSSLDILVNSNVDQKTLVEDFIDKKINNKSDNTNMRRNVRKERLLKNTSGLTKIKRTIFEYTTQKTYASNDPFNPYSDDLLKNRVKIEKSKE